MTELKNNWWTAKAPEIQQLADTGDTSRVVYIMALTRGHCCKMVDKHISYKFFTIKAFSGEQISENTNMEEKLNFKPQRFGSYRRPES